MKIVLSNPCPPIPIGDRNFDWSACPDGEEENCGAYGWGPTPLDALIDYAVNDERLELEAYGTDSPLIAALKQALAVMNEPVAPMAMKDPEQLVFILGEQMHRIERGLKTALRMLGEPS